MTITKVFLISLLVATAGCASVGVQRDLASASCGAHFADLDAAIDAAGVRDGGEARMENFPYLRANRFLVSFADDFKAEHARQALRFTEWVAELSALDQAARTAEISNLPSAAAARLGMSKSELRARTDDCAVLIMSADMSDAARRAAMIAAARVPDDYSGFKRLLGAYPLTKIPFFLGVENCGD